MAGEDSGRGDVRPHMISAKNKIPAKKLVRRSMYKSGPTKCRECGKMFKKTGMLKLHMKVHGGESEVKCDICGRQFAHQGALTRHWRMCVTMQPKYKSSSPAKATKAAKSPVKPGKPVKQTQQDLYSELDMTVKAKSWSKGAASLVSPPASQSEDEALDMTSNHCKACRSGFSDKSRLYRHTCSDGGGAANADRKVYTCSICGGKFAKANELRAHSKEHKRERSGANQNSTPDHVEVVIESSNQAINTSSPRRYYGMERNGS